MVNQDYLFRLQELNHRVTELEGILLKREAGPDISALDWDNATLTQQWNISKRTAANYRQKGLEYYKRGGRIYYPPEGRAKFIMESNR